MPGKSHGLILAVLAIFCPLLIAQDGNMPEDKKQAIDRVLSLKGKMEDFEDLVLVGPKANEYVHFEPEGARGISLPAGFVGERPATGIGLATPISDNFEITVNFEVLQEPRPADVGDGATRLILMAIPPDGRFASIAWRVNAKFGTQISAYAMGGGYKAMATDKRKGRFRLARVGSEIFCLFAADASDHFDLLRKLTFGPEPLRLVQLVGVTSDAKAALEVRFSDLRVRAGPVVQPMTPSTQAKVTPERSSVALWLLVLLVIIMTVFLALWVYNNRTKKAE